MNEIKAALLEAVAEIDDESLSAALFAALDVLEGGGDRSKATALLMAAKAAPKRGSKAHKRQQATKYVAEIRKHNKQTNTLLQKQLADELAGRHHAPESRSGKAHAKRMAKHEERLKKHIQRGQGLNDKLKKLDPKRFAQEEQRALAEADKAGDRMAKKRAAADAKGPPKKKAGAKKAVPAKGKESPDKYKKRTGKCPRGYRVDSKGKCVKR